MLTKSPTFYKHKHVQFTKSICLHCHKTAWKYISNYNSGYAFKCKTFDMILQKKKDNESYLRHEELIIDEMKLTEKL